ncbi:MAG: lamin tail domain-containing protein, partial [Flavobacteriales bacterium]
NPVITEIMYNPPEAGNDSLEFLEIYNPNLSNQFSLAGAYFSSGIEYTFPSDYVLGAGAYVIISGDSLVFEEVYGVESFEWSGGTALSNDGEGIALRNGNGFVMDTVDFDDTNAWADADATGYSLVLCNPNADNNLPESWTLSENATGIMVDGTEIFADPGMAATCTPTGITDENVISTVVYPNPAKDVFNLRFENTTESGAINVLNSLGQTVFTKSISVGTTATSIDANLPSGFYLVAIRFGNKTENIRLVVE